MDTTSWLKVIILIIIFTSGVITNGLIVSINYLSTIKQKPGFIMVLNLAIADLMYLSNLPIFIHDEMLRKTFMSGRLGCLLHSCLRVSSNFNHHRLIQQPMALIMSMLLLAFMSIDRYKAITNIITGSFDQISTKVYRGVIASCWFFR